MNIERSTQDPSIGELVSQLSWQTSRLVRHEMKLAQKEFRETAKHAGLGAGLFSGTGLLAVLGLATLVTLGDRCPRAGVAALGGGPGHRCRAVRRCGHRRSAQQEAVATDPVPQQTVASVKQDINEVKDARHEQH